MDNVGRIVDEVLNELSDEVTAEQATALRGLVRRRDFLQLSGLGLLGVALLGTSCTKKQIEQLIDSIKKRPVRRDINKLAPTDPILQSYRKAVSAMKALPASDPRNWTRQAQIHLNYCPHGNWLFLPWHRAYLYYFEEICREMSGNNAFALPYWDWTANPQVPAVFWQTSDPLYDPTRGATASDVISPAIVGQPVIDNILSETNFLNFASGSIPATANQRTPSSYGPLEGIPHNNVHGFVGGNMGNFMSPLDPVFWTHHNRIEQLWVQWNLTMGNPNTNDTAWTGRKFTEFYDRKGMPVEISVAVMALFPLLKYRFDNQGV